MGLFKEYYAVSPIDYPYNWLSRPNSRSQSYFRIFFTAIIEILELNRLKKLSDKKSVKEFLSPVIGNGFYNIVYSMTDGELDAMPDFSTQRHEKKLFGLVKNNETTFKFQNKEVVPHKLKLFSKFVLPETIIPLEPVKEILDNTKEIRICRYCEKGETQFTYQAENYHLSTTPANYAQGTAASTHRVYEGTYYTAYGSRKCNNCDGKWKSGFTFKDFLKYVREFNEKIEKINKEISTVNEKNYTLVDEYNKTIEKLNQKISIWNSKCPQNAIDDKHESKDDVLKFWGKDKIYSDVSRVSNSANDLDVLTYNSTRGSLPRGFESPSVTQSSAETLQNSTRGSLPRGFESPSVTQSSVETPQNSTRGSLPRGFESPSVTQSSAESSKGGIPYLGEEPHLKHIMDLLNKNKTISNDVKNDVPQQSSDDPLKILKMRFAKGEITKEEFEEMKEMLE